MGEERAALFKGKGGKGEKRFFLGKEGGETALCFGGRSGAEGGATLSLGREGGKKVEQRVARWGRGMKGQRSCVWQLVALLCWRFAIAWRSYF